MPVQSIVMFLAALGFLYLIIRNMNKNAISFDQAFLWLLVGGVLLLISIFRYVPVWFAQLLGFELTSNFLLSLAVFFLLLIAFLNSLIVSQQKEDIKRLVQELSITQKKLREVEKQDD